MKRNLIISALGIGLLFCSAGSRAQPLAPQSQADMVRARLAARSAILRAEWAARTARGDVPAKIVEPYLMGGTIVTPNINVTAAPGLPEVQLQLNAGNVGIDSVSATIVSPSGMKGIVTIYSLPDFPPEPHKQSLMLQLKPIFANLGFGLYSESGAWTLQSVSLSFKDDNSHDYTGQELASLFPSLIINVTNPNPADITPPAFGKGKILTRSISLGAASPYFAAKLAVADDVSGVANLNLQITPPNGGQFDGPSAIPPAPVVNGTLVPAVGIPPGSPTGTYTITAISLCDVAGNCAFDANAADIKHAFGTTTFQVTD
jgi:hypothetical protein